MTETAGKELSLSLSRTFAAPRERVFAAWTDPAQMSRWFCSPSSENFKAEVDLKVGGRYTIGMRNRETGEEYITNGTYKEVRPPERLVFTWLWEGQDPETHTTLVTLDFRDMGDKTEIVLKHEGFPDQNMCDQHNQGWQGCFSSLEKYIGE
jgi:uncharacterized protein YndB with AHSA1/START domain